MTANARSHFLTQKRLIVLVTVLTSLFGLTQSEALRASQGEALAIPFAYFIVAIVNKKLLQGARAYDSKNYVVEIVASLIITAFAFGSVVLALVAGGRTGNISGSVYYTTILLEYLAVLIFSRW